MSNQERWDVALKVLSGPLAGLGEQVFRGPVVRIGANPGAGGLTLTGYRGLDARQAVITAYDGGTAAIAPVGTNQVRMAPHAQVNWKEIDPVNGPQYLSKGCALHLGPVGRGCTIEFVECRSLAVWQKGDLSSEADSVGVQAGKKPQPGMGIVANPGGPPAAVDARKVGKVRTSIVPIWFVGGLFLMTTVAVSLMLVVGGWIWLNQKPKPLGPSVEGPDDYWKSDFVDADPKVLAKMGLLDGLQKPFAAFVMQPNMEKSGRKSLSDASNWDQKFYNQTVAAAVKYGSWFAFYRQLEASEKHFAMVTEKLQDAGLPEVLAMISYRESNYDTNRQDPLLCAKGLWQFQPEIAYRVGKRSGLPFQVASCGFTDAPTANWSPTTEYMEQPPKYAPDGQCRIPPDHGCKIDDRTDAQKATDAAIYTFKEAFNDEDFQKSGALVQLVVMTNNMGYDDNRFRGVDKPGNLKGAYLRWKAGKSDADLPNFYGDNIKCEGEGKTLEEFRDKCGGQLPRVTQTYAYSIVARQILAVCYYARNHGDERAFSGWKRYLDGDDGYCSKFKIPSAGELH